jgi:SAM-dependent methyltransferase
VKEIAARLRPRFRTLARAHPSGEERTSDWYDKRFSESPVYRVAYPDSPYYFIWAVIADRVRRAGLKRVLEIGCGTGQLAAFLLDQGVEEYFGFDFSATAVEYAREAAPAAHFVVADARDTGSFPGTPYDVLICTEVLEHIDEDLAVVSSWPSEMHCIFSVPNYDSGGHVRFFDDVAAVRTRYGAYFTDLDIAHFPASGQGNHKLFLAEGYRNAFQSDA